MKCCLIGERLGHSYSKVIHEAFGEYGYDLVELKKNQLKDFVLSVDYDAFNVTIPYKQDIMPLLDEVDEKARNIGAVNTVFRKNSRLCGTNTDFDGMIYMINSAGIEIANKSVLILGSGGTSKTAVAVASKLKAKSVTVVSRTGEVNYENCYQLTSTNVIINTTPVGMYPNIDGKPIELAKFACLEGVVDVIYNPINTRLLLEAKALGLKAVGGMSMLVSQAKYALDEFTASKHSDSTISSVYQRLLKSTLNVVLIGMPGSGKTSMGKAIAKRLGKNFVDVDAKIVEREGKSIPEIFSGHGEEYFREIEKDVIKEIGKQKCQVISTGGGVVLNYDNYAPLKANGFIVYVDRPIEKLATTGRPLSKDMDSLVKMKSVRQPLYQRFADYSVINDGDFYTCVDKIMEIFNENFGN